jgi:hypothetical protein
MLDELGHRFLLLSVNLVVPWASAEKGLALSLFFSCHQ